MYQHASSQVVYFTVFTMFSAYVILSLFITIITAVMFEVIELKRRDIEAKRWPHGLAPRDGYSTVA